MKVICAGFCKTGLGSMNAALRELGYEPYDYLDHFWHHGDEWKKILSSGPGGNLNDFKRMYKDVDAVIDGPPMWFWEEILKAFPDAKIILTTKDEDCLYESLKAHVELMKNNFVFNFMQLMTPFGRKYYNHHIKLVQAYFGSSLRYPFDYRYIENKQTVKKAVRQHQAYCLQNAPKDKLLVYNVSEGWEPLCKFLGKKIPDKPFPQEKMGDNVVEKLMATHPSMLYAQKQLFYVLLIIAAIISVLAYFVFA